MSRPPENYASWFSRKCGQQTQATHELNCDSCNFLANGGCRDCLLETLENWKQNELKDTILFRRLNGLTPTFQSCRDKVYEEIGELMQLLGKGQRASGETNEESSYPDWVYRVVEEALDSAQALVTLVNTLADENNVDIQGEIGRHEAKLVRKGYLINEEVPQNV